MKVVSDSLRFLLEVTSLFFLVRNGFKYYTGDYKLALGVLLPIAIIIFWSIFMAPKSGYRFDEIGRLFVEVVLFGGIALQLYLLGETDYLKFYVIFASVSTLCEHVLLRW